LSQVKTNFSRYLPLPREAEAWGLAVTGGGRLQSMPSAPYPPDGHPVDHAFSWDHGRVLGAWQLVAITAGGGWFESASQSLSAVSSGDLLLLFPGEWHRYRPDAETGWTELWLELQGPALARLQTEGVLSPDSPVQRFKGTSAEALLARLHTRLRENTSGFDPELAGWAWQLLAQIVTARRRASPAESDIARAVRRAETLLADRLENPPAMPALARELGVAYSYFRREFAKRTGLSPHAYLLRLRLEKARRLLGNGTAPLKDIAAQLGFSSPYHLSAAFKQAFGTAPAYWRRRPARTGG
jgi:AraC-like DNA-binding protein